MLLVLAAISVAIVAVLLVATTRPPRFRVERSVPIGAPLGCVIPFIDDLRKWPEWSAEPADPTETRAYNDLTRGVGAACAWDSRGRAGKGRMEILNMKSERFEAQVVEGHKGVVVALVPFDPAVVFQRPPIRLAGRRHGWPARGTVNRVAFEGYVGERWGRFFIILDESLRAASGAAPGDRVRVTLTPSTSPETITKAIEQSKVTTQPKKARADALLPDPT